MLYRRLGKTDLDVSILGFGCMRLPAEGGGPPLAPDSRVDEKETARMIHHAIENGVNLFDTAYPYHGGQSEIVLGKALQNGYRSRVYVSTKLPAWKVKGAGDFDALLEEQMSRLRTDYLDFYLMHGMDRGTWRRMVELDVANFLDRVVKDGRVRYAGFSFHDDEGAFREVVDGYPWAMCLIQYNYYDEHNQAGRAGLMYAAGKDLGVAIMEPLRGGQLARKLPLEVQRVFNGSRVQRTPAEWALRWLWNQSEVATVLSGMSSMVELEENLEFANNGHPGSLSDNELEVIQRAKEAFAGKARVECTRCDYCLPCAQGVNIPEVLTLFNEAHVFEDPDTPSFVYNNFLSPEQRASRCDDCGECEEKCPQAIPIRDALREAEKVLGKTG
jgi:predicted aldo/keto reductase-like oxidoreductase